MRGMTQYGPTTLPQHTLRSMIGFYMLILLLFLTTGALIMVQATRSELQPADAAIVMLDGNDAGDAARIKRAQQLFIDRKVSRIVLAGHEPGAGRALLKDTVGDAAVVEVRESSQVAQLAVVRQVLEEQHLQSALLIAEPVETLRLLKIARDTGMEPLSAPVGADPQLSFLGTLLEIGHYFRYVLFQM